MRSSAVSQVIKNFEKKHSAVELSNNLKINHHKIIFGKDNEFELRIADTIELRKKAYQLIYKIYLEKNFTQAHPSEMWFSKYDAFDSTVTLVVIKDDDDVVGALTLVFDSADGVPADDLYKEELSSLRSSRKELVELVSLGIDPKLRGATEVLINLFNASLIISKDICGKDKFVITINPRHVSFYSRKMAFCSLGGLKACQKVGGAPSKLLDLDLREYKRLIESVRNQGVKTKTFYDSFVSPKEVQLLCPIFNKQMQSAQQSLQHINEIMVTRDEVAEELNLFELY